MSEPIYSQGLGRYIRRSAVTLKTSGAEIVSTTGVAVELGDESSLYLLLNVTAASGTVPLLDITIEGSDDNSNWFTLGTFAQKTAVSAERKVFSCCRFARYRSTIAGTSPSFTYSIAGNA